MDRLYKVVAIEGKDLGCIAIKDIKKGTLLLQEKPQMVPSLTDLKSVITTYNQMSDVHKEDFLKLHNRFHDQNMLNEQDKDMQNQIHAWIKLNDDFIMENMMGIYDYFSDIFATFYLVGRSG